MTTIWIVFFSMLDDCLFLFLFFVWVVIFYLSVHFTNYFYYILILYILTFDFVYVCMYYPCIFKVKVCLDQLEASVEFIYIKNISIDIKKAALHFSLQCYVFVCLLSSNKSLGSSAIRNAS